MIKHFALAGQRLDNAESPLDNNIVERDIKRVVMRRKAWLFSDTPAGAREIPACAAGSIGDRQRH